VSKIRPNIGGSSSKRFPAVAEKLAGTGDEAYFLNVRGSTLVVGKAADVS
jgi:hypothetical protein